MEAARKKVIRGARILGTLCKVMRIVLAVLICIIGILIAGVFANQTIRDKAGELFAHNNIFQTLQLIDALNGIELKYQVAIAGATSFISFCVIAWYARQAEKLMAEIAKGEQPFTMEIARRLRRTTYALLLLLLYSPLMAVILFIAGMMLSYLIEYGAYLRVKAGETNRIQEEMIVSFAEITENKSGQTGQHIKRVSEYSRILAQELGMTAEEVENVRLASTMHDVGKLLIPSEILEKPARLTDEEYAVIKKHTSYGGQLLDNVEGDVMELSRRIALQHHERADGKGYPMGLHDQEISIEGKIVAVADVYDALTSRRSYKEAWDDQEAYDEIVRGKGTQFDSRVVAAFENAYDKINEVRQQYADKRAVS